MIRDSGVVYRDLRDTKSVNHRRESRKKAFNLQDEIKAWNFGRMQLFLYANTVPRRACQPQSRREGRPLGRPLSSDFNK
jgi:hypothetical protein